MVRTLPRENKSRSAATRILVAERRFRGITDMAGAAAGRTRTRMTQSGRNKQNIDLTRVYEARQSRRHIWQSEIIAPHVVRCCARS
jgi:hypothetical protein